MKMIDLKFSRYLTAACMTCMALPASATTQLSDEDEATYQNLLQCSVIESYEQRASAPSEKADKHALSIKNLDAYARDLKPELTDAQYEAALKKKEADILAKLNGLSPQESNRAAAKMYENCNFLSAMWVLIEAQ